MPLSIVDILPTYDERGTTINRQNPSKLERRFEVYTNEVATSEVSVINLVVLSLGVDPNGVMGIGQQHPDWPPALLETITCKADGDDPKRWNVTLSYSELTNSVQSGSNAGGGTSGAPGGAGTPAGQSPTVGPFPRSKGSFRTQDVIKAVDADGDTYVNTANMPLENPPPTRIPNGSVNIFRKYPKSSYDLYTLQQWLGKCNVSGWNSFPFHTLLIDGMDYEDIGAFWSVTWTLLFKEEGWRSVKIMSVGNVAGSRKPNGEPKTKTVNKNGIAVEILETSVLLDASGRPTGPQFLDSEGIPADPTMPIDNDAHTPSSNEYIYGPAELTYNPNKSISFQTIFGTSL